MNSRWNCYFAASLFGLALLGAGCAAREVDVQQRGPIRGEATVEGDSPSARGGTQSGTESEESKGRSSGQTSGSGSGSVSGSGG